MREQTSDFSKGNIPGLILSLGLPVMMAELVHVLYNIVDRIYIGHMGADGTLALTGPGSTGGCRRASGLHFCAVCASM